MDRPIAAEVTDAIMAPGVRQESARQDSVTAILRRRGTTMTEVMLEPNASIRMRMMRAMLGTKRDDNTGMEIQTGKPVRPMIRLRSILLRCPECQANACGRKGKVHDIVYKTGQVEGNAKELRRVAALEGTVNLYERVEVDPETGDFEVMPLEAVKILRQYGKHIVASRQRHRVQVCEPAFEERYGQNVDNQSGRPVRPSVALVE